MKATPPPRSPEGCSWPEQRVAQGRGADLGGAAGNPSGSGHGAPRVEARPVRRSQRPRGRGRRAADCGEKGVVIPCHGALGIGSVPFLDFCILVCKMEPMICCLEVAENRGFRVGKTWVRVQTPPFTHCYMDIRGSVLRLSSSVKGRYCSCFTTHFC